jgi:hypothetical protein
MDTFRAVVRRLRLVNFVLGVLVACMASFLVPVSAFAATTQAAAYQECLQEEQAIPQGGSAGYTWVQACVLTVDPSSGLESYVFQVHAASSGNTSPPLYYDFSGAPENPCSSLANFTEDMTVSPGQALPTSGVQNVTDPISGATVGCPFSMSWSGNPVADAYGHYHEQVTASFAGNPGASSSQGSSGTNTYDGSNGQPTSPQPGATSGASPDLCGSDSCYNPNSGSFSVVGSGGDVSLPAATAESSGGGCASSGMTTMCGGSPSPPSPVGQSGSSVTDPATQIQGSDNYSVLNPSTGGVSGTTINVYSSGGTTSSGAPSGAIAATKGSSSTTSGASTSPASSSSSGNGDSFNGGGNCNTPPVCTGDAVMCGIAQESWQTSCNVSIETTALAGSNPSQSPPTFASDQTAYTQSQVWVQGNQQSNTEGGQANQGSYNMSGFGYSTQCPMQDFTFSTVAVTVPLASKGCQPLSYFRPLAIGFALFAAYRITAGGTD